ncbi:hypothetical protein B566_EDAN003589 [Ephemera danica]|nr:hypothetical protein B566_EDAN003589 [Ephemera danica]
MESSLAATEANTTTWSNITNSTDGPAVNRSQQRQIDPFMPRLYLYSIPPMLIFCLATVVVNAVVVASTRWIRRPLSPTLLFSVSLALADAYASLVMGIGTCNLLIILKTFVDPVIYAARMHEIKMALRRMKLWCCRCCPGSVSGMVNSEMSQHRVSLYMSRHRRHSAGVNDNTSVCRMQSLRSSNNGSIRANHVTATWHRHEQKDNINSSTLI